MLHDVYKCIYTSRQGSDTRVCSVWYIVAIHVHICATSVLYIIYIYLYWFSLAPSQHGGQRHGSLDQSEQLSDSYSIPPSAPKERIQHQSVFFSWWLLLSVLPDRTHPAPSLLSELSRLMVLTHVTFHYIRTTATFL